MLVPEAWQENDDLPGSHQAMYRYLASVMEPWDGPAALAMTDGRWVVAGMDRNALRPLRYTQTADNLLIVGSEAGMVVVPESRSEEHTSDLQSLMRHSYAVFCLTKKNQ